MSRPRQFCSSPPLAASIRPSLFHFHFSLFHFPPFRMRYHSLSHRSLSPNESRIKKLIRVSRDAESRRRRVPDFPPRRPGTRRHRPRLATSIFAKDSARESAPLRGWPLRPARRRARPRNMESRRNLDERSLIHARARPPAGFHRRPHNRGPRSHARSHAQSRRQSKKNQSAPPRRSRH